MAKLKQLASFVSVAARGSLTAAALAEGVALSVPAQRSGVRRNILAVQ